jgi:hypothetical protein
LQLSIDDRLQAIIQIQVGNFSTPVKINKKKKKNWTVDLDKGSVGKKISVNKAI